MSGSGTVTRISWNKRWPRCSSGSSCLRSKPWSCAIWSKTRTWPKILLMHRGRCFSCTGEGNAEETGRDVVRVNPAYTSQTCSACGHRQPMPLSVWVYECPHCGLVLHRDHNGSNNILAEAFQAVGHTAASFQKPCLIGVGSRHKKLNVVKKASALLVERRSACPPVM
jgi:predicted RNA-binding Zn-ribbon protein involved in translation (DUF1610 family)